VETNAVEPFKNRPMDLIKLGELSRFAGRVRAPAKLVRLMGKLFLSGWEGAVWEI
jgi:hypothetical protein